MLLYSSAWAAGQLGNTNLAYPYPSLYFVCLETAVTIHCPSLVLATNTNVHAHAHTHMGTTFTTPAIVGRPTVKLHAQLLFSRQKHIRNRFTSAHIHSLTNLSVVMVDHDVVWLDVSVHDPHAVAVVESPEKLVEVVSDVIVGQL